MFFLNYSAIIYLLKVNDRNTRKRCEICSKLTIINFEHAIAGCVVYSFILDLKQMKTIQIKI